MAGYFQVKTIHGTEVSFRRERRTPPTEVMLGLGVESRDKDLGLADLAGDSARPIRSFTSVSNSRKIEARKKASRVESSFRE